MALRKTEGPSFFDLFTQQASNLVKAADLLGEIVSATPAARVEPRNSLHDVEHEGDTLSHDVIQKINMTFVTPFDREDLSALTSCLDDCLDDMDEAGDLIVLYDIDGLPETVSEHIFAQVDVLKRCAALTAEAMPRLKDPLDLRDYWIEINRLENEGDRAYRHALAALFNSSLDPVTIIKVKDFVQVVERSVDGFEDLANTIENLAVKES